MNKYYYDLHIHSCLSPCADNDMTPNNIAGMATLSGLNIVALTDHNTTENCPAFFAAAKRNGIIPVAGMELTTAEDIHIICLFENLGDAVKFGETVKKHRIQIPNRTDIFGDQFITDENDNIIGTDEFLLSNATDIPVDDVPHLAAEYNGISYPAHIDRDANGIIATLGTLPDIPGFECVELHDAAKAEEYKKLYPAIKEKTTVFCSDAHFLWDIKDKEAYFEIDDEPYSSDKIRHELFKILKNEK